MNTDRELLEAAARAARIEGEYSDFMSAIQRHPGKETPSGKAYSFWNPLADDGEALRLAVKLDMHCVDAFPVPSMALVNECGGDQYAATRRSIVLAAASLDPLPSKGA